ncbi:MAG TPA: site-specific DNA-methyltransferase, partial [Archaeoglobaceae archaeon]|nr:site-specific DNA-methyltransferase [Archaeoglobaceae archaeon]
NERFDPKRHKLYSSGLHPFQIAEKIARSENRDRHPIDVWPISSACYKGPHEATFPLEIPIRAFLASSKKGDLVLDPFVGSGTTMEAAQLLERDSIGIDISPLSKSMVAERLKEKIKQRTLDNSFSFEIYE